MSSLRRATVITADNITDEQIELLFQGRDLLTSCIAAVALGEMHPRVQRLTFAQTIELNRCAGRNAARARCAEIINASEKR